MEPSLILEPALGFVSRDGAQAVLVLLKSVLLK